MERLFQPPKSNLINQILELELRATESFVYQKNGSFKTFKETQIEELPHIYVCDAFDLLVNRNIFAKISTGLMSQHWLLANALKQIDEMKEEATVKRQEMLKYMSQELRSNTDGSITSHYKADGKYQELVSRYIDVAIPLLGCMGGSIDDLKPEPEPRLYDTDDPRFALDAVFDLIDETLTDMEQEVRLRAFTSLRRVFIKGLRDITEEWKNKKSNWQEWERLERREPEYVHLLRQLAKNCPGHGIDDFTRKLKRHDEGNKQESALFRLNQLRNAAEHDEGGDNSDCLDSDQHSEEQLLACFREVKALFETLEQASVEDKEWYA